jgi:hypothetical protein
MKEHVIDSQERFVMSRTRLEVRDQFKNQKKYSEKLTFKEFNA